MTDVEWWLVLLATTGWSDREIAEATGETPRRVKAHFQGLLDKLDLADRLTLILASFADEPRIPSHIRRGYDKIFKQRRTS
jgi:DNA-binding NarL/FixJ family response regulator